MEGVLRKWTVAITAAATTAACSVVEDSGGKRDPGIQEPISCERIDPGRVTLHRLNRTEYNNTVQDLLGVDLRPADTFPQDDTGHGYDNMADVLTIAPLLMEKYDEAAGRLVEAALAPGSSSRSMLVGCDPAIAGDATCAREILESFLPRAFRRPATDEEVTRYLGFFDVARGEGDGFEQGLRLAMHAVLVSPDFLFRVELDPPAGQVRTLNGYELASRLSYFLWSTMPDEELFRAAGDGTLDTEQGLEAQVDRMLAHPKAVALVENFGGQWLTTRALARMTPDPSIFPEWDEPLRHAMEMETKLVFAEILDRDRSLLDLLDTDFTYVNERLARHYGIEGISGDDFQRIATPDNRSGILTHGSFLTLTSNPTRTSPVKRGTWVLAQLLCQEPPPPPPGVEGLPEPEVPTGTVREQMEAHRSDPTCAACHVLMDPIGFGLEDYGPTGAYRTIDEAGFPIDSSGELPDGSIFDGAIQLAQVLKGDPSLSLCMAEHGMMYALGRQLLRSDTCAVEAVTESFREGGNTFAALAKAIVTSEPFRKRAAEKEGAK